MSSKISRKCFFLRARSARACAAFVLRPPPGRTLPRNGSPFLGILMLFNLLAEFQRATGMAGYRQPTSLRAQVFLCGAILGRAGHRTVLHLSAAWEGLKKRNSLFDHLLSYGIPTSRKLELPAPATS